MRPRELARPHASRRPPPAVVASNASCRPAGASGAGEIPATVEEATDWAQREVVKKGELTEETDNIVVECTADEYFGILDAMRALGFHTWAFDEVTLDAHTVTHWRVEWRRSLLQL